MTTRQALLDVRQMRYCLKVRRVRGAGLPGEAREHRYAFEQEEVLIGRDEAVEVRLPDPGVSLVHLRLRVKKGRLFALDEGSTNGTWLAGRRLSPQQPVELTPGACLAVGPFVIGVEEPSGEQLTQAADTARLARQMVLEVLGALGDAHPCLEVASGPQQGVRLEIPPGEPLLVGRGELCALRLEDADVSRQHLELRQSGGRVMARDLGSKNGLLVNGERATGTVLLRHGDELRVGGTLLRFSDAVERYLADPAEELPGTAAPAARPPASPEPPRSPPREPASPEPPRSPPREPASPAAPTTAAGRSLLALLISAGLLMAAGLAALIYLLV